MSKQTLIAPIHRIFCFSEIYKDTLSALIEQGDGHTVKVTYPQLANIIELSKGGTRHRILRLIEMGYLIRTSESTYQIQHDFIARKVKYWEDVRDGLITLPNNIVIEEKDANGEIVSVVEFC